jgi:hypothetical protein
VRVAQGSTSANNREPGCRAKIGLRAEIEEVNPTQGAFIQNTMHVDRDVLALTDARREKGV